MSNRDYNTIEELVDDASFINWVNKAQLTDVQFWEHWIQANPSKIELTNDAKAIVLGIQFNKTTLSDSKINGEWDKFEDKIFGHTNHTKRILPFYKNRTVLNIAATLLLFVAVTAIYFTNKSTTIVHTTAFGEISDINMPDSTRVKLNSNSTLSYDDSKIREVFLEGEAYFNVEKKPATKAKFIVKTADLDIEVFGTSFNVNNRKAK